MSIKVAQNDSTRKIKDFDTCKKFLKCGWFGQNNWWHRLWKVAQSAKIAQSGHIVCDLEDLLAQSQFMTF